MKNGNGISGQDASDDDGLAEAARSTLAQRQQEAFEEGTGLEERLPQRLEEVEVQPLVGFDVVANSRQQNLEKKSNKIIV